MNRRRPGGAAGLGAAADAPATATPAPSPRGYFLDAGRYRTCAAICARLVPSGPDPAREPGATEAGAVVFIDRFLSAFELPAAVADNPAIWLRGRFSGRQPSPGDGHPGRRPPSDFLDPSGRAHFLPLTRGQEMAWRARLYGVEGVAGGDPRWASQVAAGTIPGVLPGGLRRAYAEGLDAFDGYALAVAGCPFALAGEEDQDLMLAVAGHVPLAGLGIRAEAPRTPAPRAAQVLFPLIRTHTFHACYGLPEYAWRRSNPLWAAIGYDGDTLPLGNTASRDGGDHHQWRPVSHLDPGGGPLVAAAELFQILADGSG
ncbi:MAG TPA: gluconate 2-dehydrogenase subunit 3 family protein [Acidimicrobiales bacterium]|nr:gluconate 2-dehydrogenase subunit 3 family protein [Acidimicrobiales bacterium]